MLLTFSANRSVHGKSIQRPAQLRTVLPHCVHPENNFNLQQNK